MAPGDAVKIGNNFLFKESKNAILNGLLGVCKALSRKARKNAGIYLTKVRKYPGIPSYADIIVDKLSLPLKDTTRYKENTDNDNLINFGST